VIWLSGFVAGIAACLVAEFVWWHFRPKGTLTIIGATNMADVGKPFAFTVVAKNAAGAVVPDNTITVSTDNGTVTVASDGSGGVLTPGSAGTANLTATDGTLTTSLAVAVADDLTPASLTIVPG